MIEESIDDRLMTWIVDLSDWNPSEMEFDSIIDLFPIEIAHKVRSYHHRIDAKRSLVGTLLVQSVVYHTYSIAWQDIRFSKNSYGKPYLLTPLPPPRAQHGFCFNISHDTDLVVCSFILRTGSDRRGGGSASTPSSDDDDEPPSPHPLQIGVDIMACRLPGHERQVDGLLSSLEDHLTATEKVLIEPLRRRRSSELSSSEALRPAEERALLEALLQMWTFKESVIKALGLGLGVIDLDSIGLNRFMSPETESDSGASELDQQRSDSNASSFLLPARSELALSIDDRLGPNWKFWTTYLSRDRSHPARWTMSKTTRDRDDHYILSVAIKLGDDPHLGSSSFADRSIVHRIELKSISELLDRSPLVTTTTPSYHSN